MLNDFIGAVDEFYIHYESLNSSKEEEDSTIEKEKGKGERKGGVDSLYLEALECYCLLKCRLIKMKTQWQSLVRILLPEDSCKGY